jgi:tRNA dimethylallyltransferase
MDRDALYARIDARVDAMLAAGRRRGGPPRERRGGVGHRAQGARLRRAAGRRRRGHEAPHPQLRRRQLTWMRKLPGVELVDVTGRHADEVAATLIA